jgi:hypothetical protein
MDPNYPMNPAFHQPGQHPYPASASLPPSSAQQVGQVGPGIPGHHHGQYPYAVHGGYPHGYGSYPHYAPSPVVIYPPPRVGDHPMSQVASPASADPHKRKRKSTDPRPGAVSDEEGGSGSDVNRPSAHRQGSSNAASEAAKKRTKTQRACDSCRSRKIRLVGCHLLLMS